MRLVLRRPNLNSLLIMNHRAFLLIVAALLVSVIGINIRHGSTEKIRFARSPDGSPAIYPQLTAAVAAAPVQPTLAAAGTPTGGSRSNALSDGEWRSIEEQIAAADREFVSPGDKPGVHRAFNRDRNLAFEVSAEAIEVRPRATPAAADSSSAADADWSVRLRWTGSSPDSSPALAKRDRVEIHRGDIVEWYVHRTDGLEQGFTLAQPPAGQTPELVQLDLQLETTLVPMSVPDSDTVRFVDRAGRTVVSYEKIRAFDASGRELPAEMRLLAGTTATAGTIRLAVQTLGATYPVTIDPLLTAAPLTIPEATLVLPDLGIYGSNRPHKVALDGNTLAVGTVSYSVDPYDPAKRYQGAVQIFDRQTNGSWSLTKIVQSTTAFADMYFGSSVALHGDTLVAANVSNPGDNVMDGAYVFQRNAGGANHWGQVKELQPIDPNVLGFGTDVAVRGDWVFVGCESGEWAGRTGRVFAFHRNQGGANNWGQIQRIQAPLPEQYDWFGASLAVSPNGEFLVIGAPGTGSGDPSSGAAYLYAAEAGVFLPIRTLTPAQGSRQGMGSSVAISDTSFAVTTLGDGSDANFKGTVSVYAYSRQYLPPFGYIYDVNGPQIIEPPAEHAHKTFGHSLGLTSSYLCIGQDEARNQAGYSTAEPLFFYQPDALGQWVHSRTMFDPHATASNRFGFSFALSDTRLAVAAMLNDEVEIYALDGTAGDNLGSSVGISGDAIVVGASQADGLAAGSGAAYVFQKQTGNQEPWGLRRKIMADDGAGGDLFGYSASMSGDIIIIGAPLDSDHGQGSGAAYGFARNFGGTGAWGQVQKFAPADGAASDYFGWAVGISGNRVVIGAPYHDAFGANEGTAYVYESGVFAAKLDGFVATAGDRFGFSVAIDADFIVVGAPYNDFNGGMTNAGVVIAFKRDPGTDLWGEYGTLLPSSPGWDEKFGWSVATYAGQAVVGAPFRDEGMAVDSGAAYLFSPIPVFAGAETRKFLPHDVANYKQFGTSVAFTGTRALVGADGASFLPDYAGAVYVFEKDYGGAGTWGQAMKRIPENGGDDDLFGFVVACAGDTLVVGAPWHDGLHTDSGAAYFYGYDANDPPTDLTLAPAAVAENLPVGTVVGMLSASDPDLEDGHAYTLVPGTGSSDNGLFLVSGTQLKTNEVFDYEIHASYQIRLQATDLNGASCQKPLVVQIVDVTEQDNDGDGLTKTQEDALGTSDNDRDSDDDGFEDGTEYFSLHTDPTDPRSGLFIVSFEKTATMVTLWWTSVEGVTYYIDQSHDVPLVDWIEVPGSQITASAGLTGRQVPVSPVGAPRIFYRVRVPNSQQP
jgi:hypothetical protein